jgi:DNA polymerase III delta subunit
MSGPEKKDPAMEPWLNAFADRVVAGVNFRSPSEEEIPARVRQLARDHGKSIAPRAVELLVKAVGNDLLAVNNELAKLSIYIADRTEIGPRDVEMVVGELKTRSIWDLCDAVLSGRAAGAFSLLGRLLETGLAVPQFTGALRWRLSQLVSGRGRGRAGGAPAGLDGRLEEAFELLYEAEFSVNTGRRSSPMAMTLLIDRLCRVFASAEG